MIGQQAVLRASQWCYEGVWSVVTRWLCVPEAPPELQGAADASIQAFRPAEGYLRYQKLFFWIGLLGFDLVMVIIWLVLLFANTLIGLLLAPLFWFIIIAPDILVYIGIHLRYDTTWYVLSDRTLRIRRGIWVVREVTITYENIQNVSVRQGPVQRYFGISDLVVQTAGGGAAGPHGEQNLAGHTGVLEGIANAQEVRELIMTRWRTAKSSGLGDEHKKAVLQPGATAAGEFSRAEIQVLQEVRDLVVRLI